MSSSGGKRSEYLLAMLRDQPVWDINPRTDDRLDDGQILSSAQHPKNRHRIHAGCIRHRFPVNLQRVVCAEGEHTNARIAILQETIRELWVRHDIGLIKRTEIIWRLRCQSLLAIKLCFYFVGRRGAVKHGDVNDRLANRKLKQA